MDRDFLRTRLTQLRMKKGVSEYQMSYDLGHSKGYIQNITSGRSYPRFPDFLEICSYLGVTPSSFFDEKDENPILLQKAIDGMRGLSDEQLLALIGVINQLKRN